MKKQLFVLGLAFIVAGAQAQVTNLWNDQAPSGGTMGLTLTNVGGAHGDVGSFDSNAASTNVSRYSSAAQDWSAYAGLDWTLTADIYITSAQLADASVADDTISFEVGGLAGGSLTLSNASWWTPDAWNTVYFTGTFDTALSALTNTTAAFVNNSQSTHPASGINYLIDNINLNVEVREVLWDDPDPVGGNMALSQIADPFGTGHGNIAEFDSTAQAGQWQNYNSGGMNLTAYAGKKWKFTADIYITSNQLANAAISDDNFYYSVAGAAGGYTTVSGAGWVADSWNTVVWTGTLPVDPAVLSSASANFLVNDQTTHPGGVNFYFDNFKFEVQSAPLPATDVLWTDSAPSGGNMALTLVTNAYGSGIGEYNSSLDAGQWANYGTFNNDWTNYAGQAWTLSFDIYLTAAQAGDTNITDDQIYYQVAGVSGGFMSVGDVATPDAWTTVTWSGIFTNAPMALTNAFARLIDNDGGTHPAAGANYYIDNFKFEAVAPVAVVQMDDLWVDDAPVGGDMALVKISDPFGTAQGDIGMFDSVADVGQLSSYGVSGLNWSDYAGMGWMLTFDVYITAAQLADAAINDDQLSFNVGGLSGGNITISTAGWTADAWNTVKWTGTFTNDAAALGSTGCSLINDDMATHPAGGVNYLVDNFHLQAEHAEPSVPPTYVNVTNTIEFVTSEGYTNGVLNGQQSWAASSSWEADTAAGGSVSCTNINSNMTLAKGIALVSGQTIDYTVRYKILGTHVPTAWTYPARIGLSVDSNGSNQGYDGAGTSVNRAMFTLQANPSTANSFRTYGDGWNGPVGGNVTSSAGDTFALHYTMTMGDSEITTSFSLTLSNETAGVGNAAIVENGVSASFYNALKSGVYPYFETGSLGDGITGVEVLSIELLYPKEVVDSFASWAFDWGLAGANADPNADPDGDGLVNLGEYVFGGDPSPATGANDQGTQPALDRNGVTYRFSLIGDSSLVANVLTNVNLAYGSWGVADTVNVTANDGTLSEYTFDATSGSDQVFLKLEVIRN